MKWALLVLACVSGWFAGWLYVSTAQIVPYRCRLRVSERKLLHSVRNLNEALTMLFQAERQLAIQEAERYLRK